MAVRYTGSVADQSVLEEVRDILSLMSGSIATEDTAKDSKESIDEVLLELKRTRVGHELYSWGEEMDEEVE